MQSEPTKINDYSFERTERNARGGRLRERVSFCFVVFVFCFVVIYYISYFVVVKVDRVDIVKVRRFAEADWIKSLVFFFDFVCLLVGEKKGYIFLLGKGSYFSG